MVRSVDKDFEALISFLNAYSLKELTSASAGKACLKKGHKIYLSFLTLWAHCLLQVNQGKLRITGRPVTAHSHELQHFRECVADIGGGFFCCLHGAYKPAFMSLRSSIENFLRFMAAPFNSAASSTTSVFALFELAKATPPFSAKGRSHWKLLRKTYTELSKHTHSASLTHMTGIHAFSHFPALNVAEFTEWIQRANVCASAMCSALLLCDRNIYIKAHFRTKEVLDSLISPQLKLQLLRKE